MSAAHDGRLAMCSARGECRGIEEGHRRLPSESGLLGLGGITIFPKPREPMTPTLGRDTGSPEHIGIDVPSGRGRALNGPLGLGALGDSQARQGAMCSLLDGCSLLDIKGPPLPTGKEGLNTLPCVASESLCHAFAH